MSKRKIEDTTVIISIITIYVSFMIALINNLK